MRVTSLWVYPVKSCRGVALPEVQVVERGFEHDRRFMVVDPRGAFLTQRTLPAMARVRTALDGADLWLSHPGVPDCRVPLAGFDGARCDVRVWDDELTAIVHEAGSHFLRAALGLECALVHLPDDTRRPVEPTHGRPGDQVSFADAFPALLVSEASLDELNRRLAQPVTMERFRPNLVIDGTEPHAEDGLRDLRAGEVGFRAVKACERCSIPSVDPDTGARGVEPLRTLAKYRRKGGKVTFGMNLIHDGLGRIAVGDPVDSAAV